ncbi:MAG: orotidine 5'-phosphate decarboxylase / HUMPS family protein [Bacillota bacterium]
MNALRQPTVPPCLQVALDMVSLNVAVGVAERIAGKVRRLEVGTPLLLASGLAAVRRMRALAPDAVIVADTKICDAGERIALSAFEAGADVVTVVAAVADRATWEGVGRAARAEEDIAPWRRRLVMADLIGCSDEPEAARRAQELGAHEVCLHLPRWPQVGSRDVGTALARIEAVRRAVAVPVYVAGGLGPEDLPKLAGSGVDGFIVGGAVTSASDPLGVLQALHAQLSGPGTRP